MQASGVVESVGSFYISFPLTIVLVSSKSTLHIKNRGHVHASSSCPTRNRNWFPVSLLVLSKHFLSSHYPKLGYKPLSSSNHWQEIIGLPLARLAYPLSGRKFLTLYCYCTVKERGKWCWESVSMFTIYLHKGKSRLSSLLNAWCLKQWLACTSQSKIVEWTLVIVTEWLHIS